MWFNIVNANIFKHCNLHFYWLSDAKGVSCSAEIEQLREKVYGTLEEYCRTAYPEEPGRFAKLLLRLPANKQ